MKDPVQQKNIFLKQSAVECNQSTFFRAYVISNSISAVGKNVNQSKH